MKKVLKNQEGFTLVELMVVVAIIGILSTVAVPQFKKYQAKAKTSEAKVQLASVYTVEMSAMADYNVYATCLDNLGYEAQTKGYYLVGFAAAAGQTGITNMGGACAATFSFGPTGTNRLKVGATAAPTSLAAGTIPALFQSFTAAATGNVFAAETNTWTITHTKDLRQATAGQL